MGSKEDVRIVISEEIHRDGILELAEHVFNKNEPVSAAMNTSWEQASQVWKRGIDLSLQEPVSHVAINSANQVIGFRLSRIVDLKNYKPEDSLNDFVLPGPLRTIGDHVTKDWAQLLVRDNGEPCKKLLQFIALCVHPEYGGRGLGENMCRENLANGEKLGCDCCLVVGSNWMSQRIFEKLGFKMMGEVEYDEYKGDFQMKDPKQKYSRSYFLKLRKSSC